MALSTGEKAVIALLAVGGIAGAGYYLYMKNMSQYNAYAISSDGTIFVQQTGPNTVIVGLNPNAFTTTAFNSQVIEFYQVYMTIPSGKQYVLQTTQPYSSAPGDISIAAQDIKGTTWLVSSPITIDGPGYYEFSGERGAWLLLNNEVGMGDLGKTDTVSIDINKV